MVVRHITLGSASSLPGSVPCLPLESASLPFLGRAIAKRSRPELLNAPSSASAPSGPSTKRQRLPAVVPTEFGAPSVGNGLAREATLAKRMWNAQGASVDRMVKHLEEAEVHEWCMRCLGAGLVDQCGSGPGGCFPSTFWATKREIRERMVSKRIPGHRVCFWCYLPQHRIEFHDAHRLSTAVSIDAGRGVGDRGREAMTTSGGACLYKDFVLDCVTAMWSRGSRAHTR